MQLLNETGFPHQGVVDFVDNHIDPATGTEVACTQPLQDWLYDITFSRDGSRMAVFNHQGVYIYDVPAEFR